MIYTNIYNLLLLLLLSLASMFANAQTPYPTKLINVVVSLQVGTGSDVAMRNLAEKMSQAMGQPVVVSNNTGASGVLAAQQIARAAPDGYSLVALSGATLTTLPHLKKDANFNPLKDLVPIAMIVAFPSVISVNKKVPVNNIREFIELVKSNPGKFTYASGGNGSVQHTAMESFKSMAGLDLVHIPYKGMAQATTDLVGGQVDTAIQGVVAVIPFVKTGQVKVLAWTGQKRNPLYPDIPTLSESGITGYDFQSWTALFGPAGMSKEIIVKLNAQMRKAASASDLRENWRQQAMETLDYSPEQIEKIIQTEFDQMGKLIRTTGLKLE